MKALAIALLFLGPPAIALAAVDPVTGTTAVIGKGADGALCAATRDKLRAAYDAASINNNDGVNEAMQGGTQLIRGERVLVMDNATGSAYMEGVDVRIRVLSGPDAHLACWAYQKQLHLTR